VNKTGDLEESEELAQPTLVIRWTINDSRGEQTALGLNEGYDE